MLDWRNHALYVLHRSYDGAHPELEVPLSLRAHNGSVVSAEQLVSEIAQRNTKRKKTLITGRPGSGKSYIMATLAYQLAESLLTEIGNAEAAFHTQYEQIGGEEPTPFNFVPSRTTVIPVLLLLNQFNEAEYEQDSYSSKLETKLSHYFHTFGFHDPLESLLKCEAHFVFVIDDLDEVISYNASANLRDVHRFVEGLSKHPNVNVIVAGRESAANRFKHKFTTYRVCNLEIDSVRWISEQLSGPSSAAEFIENLNVDGLLGFLSTPLFAVDAARFWHESGGSFSIGLLLKRVVGGFLYRQEKTEYEEHSATILRKRSQVLEELALDNLITGGVISDVQREKIPDDYIEWYQFMEILSSPPERPAFTNDWIHAYFAAYRLTWFEVFPDKQSRRTYLKELLGKSHAHRVYTLCVMLIQQMTGENHEDLLIEVDQIYNLRHQLTEREIEWLAYGFEHKIADYIREKYSPEEMAIRFKRSYLGDGGIDVYAKKRARNRLEAWVVECKLRFGLDPTPRPGDLEQLRGYRDKVRSKLEQEAEGNDYSVKVHGILATNRTTFNDTYIDTAQSHGLEIWNVKKHATSFTPDSKITDQAIDRISKRRT